MATLGPLIGKGYVEGRGMGRVFTDMDNTEMLFFYPNKSDYRIYIQRARVQFRKPKKKNASNS